MYIGIIILPLLSFLLVSMLGRWLGIKGACNLSLIFISITCFLAYLTFIETGVAGVIVYIELWDWMSLGVLNISWGFLFDSLTSTMLIVITTISCLVHLYSISYMEADPHIIRFMSYLSLFTFFMIILVTSENFAQLFLGWEGVGVTSYLLINFWYTRVAANQAAIKAIIVNRFGDIGILIGITGLFFLIKSLDFYIVFSILEYIKNIYLSIFNLEIHALSFISFFLFIGAVGKSAQLGLHTWLPDAMEGPTPVSALIHAATMVTAGVFVLIRLSPIFEYTTVVLLIITIIGALTAFFAGTVGIFQNDLKRVIAYSTCSQLGYMVVACGLSSYSVALFHLMNHAFFKALLFLSAGAVIHAILDEQDMRKMGGLLHLLPFTFTMFIIASLALMGFPYTTGFYSKDLILELTYANLYISSIFAYWLLLLGAICTAFYSYRLIYLTFLTEINVSKNKVKYIHDAPLKMAIPMVILGLSSIFVGYICKDMFVGLGSNFLGNSIGYGSVLNQFSVIEAEFLFIGIKLLPIFLSISGAYIALVIYYYYPDYMYINNTIFLKKKLKIYKFFNKKWYFDNIYNKLIVSTILKFGYNITFKILDRGLIELIGPTGLVRLFIYIQHFFIKISSGYIFNYVFFMVSMLLVYFLCTRYLNNTSLVVIVFMYYIFYMGIINKNNQK